MRIAGIDVGATLAKLAVVAPGTLETHVMPAAAFDAARAWVVARAPDAVMATGGGARGLGATLAGRPVRIVPEFAAWAAGAARVAVADGVTLPTRYLLVSLGTGTSVLAVRGPDVVRAGGTALGGGTVLGLGRLLLGTSSFADLTALAAQGDRRHVDLLVGDLYGEHDLPLPADLTAASFAKLASTRRADVAHALMGLVGENVALLCGGFAGPAEAEAVVYGGSTLAGNPALVAIVRAITERFGHRALVLPRGAFCGAVGAAALAATDP